MNDGVTSYQVTVLVVREVHVASNENGLSFKDRPHDDDHSNRSGEDSIRACSGGWEWADHRAAALQSAPARTVSLQPQRGQDCHGGVWDGLLLLLGPAGRRGTACEGPGLLVNDRLTAMQPDDRRTAGGTLLADVDVGMATS